MRGMRLLFDRRLVPLVHHARGLAHKRIISAAEAVSHVREQVFGKTAVTDSEWSRFSWLDPQRVDEVKRQERLRIAMALRSMSVPVTLTAVKRFRFWTDFLGDERLVRTSLGREYLLTPHHTTLVQQDVRHLELLRRVMKRQRTEEQVHLKRRLSERLEAVRRAFIEARDVEDVDCELVSTKRRQPVGCLLSFVSQQLSACAGHAISRLDVRSALALHPFCAARLPCVSVLDARDLLTFLVIEQRCSAQQILSSLYVLLYDKSIVMRSLAAVTSLTCDDPKRLDVAIYEAERRWGNVASQELFGSAVFADADQLTDSLPPDLPFPQPLSSYPLLFQKILSPDSGSQE